MTGKENAMKKNANMTQPSDDEILASREAEKAATARRLSNKEFNDKWDAENNDKSFGSPEVLAAERAKGLRAEPVEAARTPEPVLPEDVPTFRIAIPTFPSPSGLRRLPGDTNSVTLLQEVQDNRREAYESFRRRAMFDAFAPIQIPRQELCDTAEAILRWGVAAKQLKARGDRGIKPIDSMAADVVETALLGPNAICSKTARLAKKLEEGNGGFYDRWLLDRLAIILLAAAPEAETNPTVMFDLDARRVEDDAVEAPTA